VRGAHFAWAHVKGRIPGADGVYRSDTQTLKQSPFDGAEYGRRMHVPAGRYRLIGSPLIPRLSLRGHRNHSNIERGSFGKQHRVAKPADLPIAGPTQFTMSANRTALKNLGLSLPSDVAARVDEWID